MRNHLLKKGGIPALACTASATGDASLLRCTFQVKYDRDLLHATFSLQYNTQVHGIEDTQSFDLIYDADNISPTTTKCQVSTLSLSPEDGKYVTRNNFGEIRVLSLNLEKPCPIICPSVASCLVFSQDFVDLAKSQQIKILFDWRWLNPKYVESFMSVVSQPERFSGFPIVQNNLKGRKQGDWTIFSPEEEHALVSKEPPPYTDPVRNDPVRKRSQRDVSYSLSPPMKRICSIPPGSPTERATTASPTNSSIPMFSTIGKRQCTTSMHNESALSRSHNEELFLHNAEIDTNVPSVSKDVISSMMLNILPAMLASVIGRPRSVSPSSSSSTEPDTHPATVPSHKSIRQLRSLLTNHAAEYTEKQLRTIYENVEYDANLVRQAADEDLLAAMEEGKWDIKEQKENSLEELSVESDQIIQEKLVEFSDQLDLLVEQAWVNIEKAIDTRVERYTNITWNKAIASGCLDQKPRVANKATREARAAGDRKRNHFGFCSRPR